MDDLPCLRELEPPYAFHSSLNVCSSLLTRYCVIADNYLNIFKDSLNILSIYRIPLNPNVELIFEFDSFTITYSNFTFSFSHKSESLISQWNVHLNKAITVDNNQIPDDFKTEVVRIDKIQKADCHIVFSKTRGRLYIYGSHNHKMSNICTHIIDLRYYCKTSIYYHENCLHPTANVLTIQNDNSELKFVFRDAFTAKVWGKLLQETIDNYMKILARIYQNESNRMCVDCGEANPRWVSINLCVTLCRQCARLHRKFGTTVSRIEMAVMNSQLEDDITLTTLFNKIGNANSNKFWNHCQQKRMSMDKGSILEKKYLKKKFANPSFLRLNSTDIVERLRDSVKSEDVTLTVSLWFAHQGYVDRKIVNELLTIAGKSNQKLQERFILLQENIDEYSPLTDEFPNPLYKGDFTLSINKEGKNERIYGVCIYKDRISIANEQEIISNIDHNYINIIIWNTVDKYICISVLEKCSIFKKNTSFGSSEYIKDIFIKDESNGCFIKFKTCLFENVIGKCAESPTDDTSLFFIADIEINLQKSTHCKCYLTNQQLILTYLEFQKYDLRKTTDLKVSEDSNRVLLTISNDNISFTVDYHKDKIFNFLTKAAKSPILSVYDENTLKKMKILIDFIKDKGLKHENVFRLCGKSKSIDSLVFKMVNTKDSFKINDDEYNVDDVTSCLKVCVKKYFDEQLVPGYAFRAMQEALGSGKDDEILSGLKKALKMLMDVNYDILRIIIDLLFTIVQFADINKMDSKNLSISTSMSILAGNENNYEDSITILTLLIDNFEYLFSCNNKQLRNL